jgi:transposase
VSAQKEGTRELQRRVRQEAMSRMQACGNIVALAKELGVSRRVLYQWRVQGTHGWGEARPRKPRDPQRELRQQLEKTKRLLGEKTLEVDFFRGALQKIEARRQNSEKTGGAASTTRSGS